jgi:predicted RNA-binding protein with PIN domain
MARMLWLIDGYNVIRRDPDLHSHEAQSLEAGRRALIQLVKQLARAIPRDEFIVVFDGARVDSAATAQGQVRILFSRPPETADDLIIRLAGRSRAGSVVVTSDRAVQQAADRAGAAVIGAESFLAQAARAAERRREDSTDIKRPPRMLTPRSVGPRRQGLLSSNERWTRRIPVILRACASVRNSS